MRRNSKSLVRKPKRQTPAMLERLEERALLSFAGGDLTAFGADGPAARPVETSSVVYDGAGNRYVSGSFVGTLSVGGTSLVSAGGRDAFLAKFGPDGAVLFARSVGGALDDSAAGVAVDAAGNAYVTGEFRGTAGFNGRTLNAGSGVGAFVWAVDTGGFTRYAAGATGGEARGLGIAVDPSGSFVAIGGAHKGNVRFGGTTLSNGGEQTAGFIARLDQAGAFTWAGQFVGVGGGSFSGAQIDRVAIGQGGSIVGAGKFNGTVDFDPSFFLNGRTSNGGSSDLAVVNINPSGELVWAYTTGGTGFDAATGVAVDSGGRVFVTGAFQGTTPFGPAGNLNAPSARTGFYLLGLESNGTPRFVTDLGATHPDLTGDGFGRPSVAVNANNGVVVATTFSGEANVGRYSTNRGSGNHAIVESFDSSGKLVRLLSVGGSGQQTVTGVALDPSGKVALTGTYTGLIGVGNQSAQPLSANGNSAFLAGLTPVSAAPDDFFGTNRTQPALFDPSNSLWSVQGPFSPGPYGTFGQPGDISVPGDYERTGTTQMAVFRPSTGQWIVSTLTGPKVVATFGATNLMDIPAPADYGGLGYTQPAVFRPSTGEWFVLGPDGGRSLGFFGATNLADLPVPADYDGDGRAEPAVFRPATAEWFVKTPTGGLLLATFGATNLADLPTPADFNGDGKAEPAVYRKATGQWFALPPGAGQQIATFGTPGGTQIPANGPAGYLHALEASKPKAPPTPPAPTPTPTPTPVVLTPTIVSPAVSGFRSVRRGALAFRPRR